MRRQEHESGTRIGRNMRRQEHEQAGKWIGSVALPEIFSAALSLLNLLEVV